MTIQLDIFAAREARDKGIETAISHAEKVNPGWKEDAYQLFKDWLKGWPTGYKFMIEDFRKIAQIRGLPDPPSNRAFGGIAVKARNSGLIKSAGLTQVKNKKAHLCFATQWEKV